MDGIDLGTYHVRVKLSDGSGFIYTWDTGARYFYGSGGIYPLDAYRLEPSWHDEADLLETIEYMFTEGNYSCDCNLRLFVARANRALEEDFPCGDELDLVELTVITPKGEEITRSVR